ncbi:hypothetical protein CMI47_15195 [Candidatus Pacearchaeota archaeon]|nr:hypothetical protein [Candidatus Pacearchaeota archaeon]|tara:strand:- start:984 stop:1454 length:471 start_codon:yes stop_codon:yes gene_type:complete
MTEEERQEKLIQGADPYEDDRGKIDNYHLPEEINLIGMITSKKGTMRANHYHPVQEQKALLVSGKFISVCKDLGKGFDGTNEADFPIQVKIVKAGDLSIIPPNIAHTMIFLEDSAFLNLVRGDRDHDKFGEHTIKYDLVKEEEVEKYVTQYGNSET